VPRQLSALRCPAGAPAPRVQGWRWLAAADTIAAGSARALRCPAGVLARVGGGPSPVEVAALAPSVPADLARVRARARRRLCVHLPKSAGAGLPVLRCPAGPGCWLVAGGLGRVGLLAFRLHRVRPQRLRIDPAARRCRPAVLQGLKPEGVRRWPGPALRWHGVAVLVSGQVPKGGGTKSLAAYRLKAQPPFHSRNM
jgi:hypothetical protein